MANLIRIAWNNHFNLPALPPPSTFDGQTVLITGATGGLGLATAVHFVNLGASSVIITARTLAKGEVAKATIEAQTGTEGRDVVKIMELDMSTLEGTKRFADQVTQEVQTIDYVLLNAGLLNNTFKLGKEGYEETIQVNAISTALLAILLLPWLKKAGRGKAHLGLVTSGLHRGVQIDKDTFPKTNVLEFFKTKENFPKDMYAVSKLFAQYVALEVAKLACGPDGSPQVIVNPMCPGIVSSDLGRVYKTNFAMVLAVGVFTSVIAKPTEGGARSLVLATLTSTEENGKYITHYQSDEDYKVAAEKSVFGAEAERLRAKIWKEVLDILEHSIPEVKEIVNSE